MTLADLKRRLRQTKFRFAKTYSDTYPHEYLVKELDAALFDEMAKLIDGKGYKSDFHGQEHTYLELDGYKYWHYETILNREPLKGYKDVEKELNASDR
ncbi:MAG: hypothetical protein WD846_04040 [Patescibacteria group bacterium]